MKTVAIMGWPQGPNSFGVGKAYLEFITEFKASPRILNQHEFVTDHGVTEDQILKVFEGVDLLLMSGGADVNPSRYNEVPGFRTQNGNLFLEWFDEYVLPTVINRTNIPIVGICRGMQSLCAYFGGNIRQDWAHPYSDKHRGELVESLSLAESIGRADIPEVLQWDENTQGGSRRRDPVGQKINSLHHQHVHWTSLADSDLNPIFVSDKTDTLEVVVSSDQRIVGFQYHPEEIYDGAACAVMTNLLYNRVERFNNNEEAGAVPDSQPNAIMTVEKGKSTE